MIHALKPFIPEPANYEPINAQDNLAVASCSQAWDRVYASMRKKKSNDDDSVAEADDAYCKAMPPLVGYENISNFIACVGYGMLTGVFLDRDGTKLLYAAQVAFNTASPRTKKSKNPPKSDPKLPVSSSLAQ